MTLSKQSAGTCSFHLDLLKTRIAANMPIFKVNNLVLREFFKKYMYQQLSDESILCKLYLTTCYEQVRLIAMQKNN